MALVVKDRVKETSTSTGTGNFTLAGAVDGFQSFSAALANGDTTYYAITDAGTGEFEVGLGTYSAGVITRTTILESTNAGAAVNFGAGEKEVFITYPAEKAVYADASGNISVPGLVDGRDLAADGSKLDGIESGATADQTGAEIKSLYEAEANTNAYTDAEKSKLAGIEAGATADQTASEIKTAYESNANTNAFTDAEQSKLAGIEAGATADQTASEILTAIKTVDGSTSGLDADLLDGQHATAFATAAQGALADSAVQPGDNISTLTNNSGYITGNQTITLSGDVSGSGTTSIVVTVADDSHNHVISNVDGLQAALDAKLDDTQKGAANGLAELDATGKVPSAQLPSYVDDVLEYAAEANFPATGETGKLYVALDTNDVYRWTGSAYVKVSDAVSTADQATKLATARNIALTGAVTGSANFDGSSNISITTTATSDPTLTINGDASGSATFTNLGNATLTLTVADDSHNHIIGNVDGLQGALDSKLPLAGGTMTGNITFNSTQLFDGRDVSADGAKLDGIEAGATADQTITAGSGLTGGGTGNVTLSHADTSSQASVNNSDGTVIQDVTLDTYGHVTGLVSYNLDGRYYTESEADSRFVNVTGDTMTGGLIIDTNTGPLLTLQATNGSPWALDLGRDDTTNSKVFNGGGYWSFEHEPRFYNAGSPQKLFHDNYHPNADKLTTARNIALTGAVTGNANFDGSGNISIATTATSDPTLTINGDASGSATFTNLGNATLTLTIADDSHNHVISNVDGLQTALDGKASTSHNHTYDVNNPWLRDNGDNANVKLYGNSRQMAFRTDGTAEYSSGVGGYPFAWMYGGDGSSQRIMLLSTSGDLWTSNNGWLSTALAGKLSTSGKAADSNLLDGIDSASFLRSDANDTWSGDISTTSTNGIRFGSSNQTDSNDGYIAAGRFSTGLNIVGTQTTAGTGRQVRIWGEVITDNGLKYWHAGNDGSGSGLDADLLDGLQLHTGRNNEANKVVRTDGSGYIQAGWINTTSGATTSTLARIYASQDGYIRYVTPATFRSQITNGYYRDGRWVNFNGTGTVSIRYSGGVSSVTDSGTGAYNVNLSPTLANAERSASFVSAFGAYNHSGSTPNDYNIQAAGQRTTSVIAASAFLSGYGFIDKLYMNVGCMTG